MFNMLVYLIIYIFTLTPLILNLKMMDMTSLTKSHNIMYFNPALSMMMFFLFLSLGGLPPMLGFMPKAMVLSSLINSSAFLMALFLIIGSLMNLYYYLSFILTFMFTSSMLNKMNLNTVPIQVIFLSLPPLIMMPPMLSLIYS